MNMDETNDCECFFQHTATLNLAGYQTLEEAGKCPTNTNHNTPLIVLGIEPSNTSVIRVTLYGDGKCAEAYFQADALSDMIDHATHGRNIFR